MSGENSVTRPPESAAISVDAFHELARSEDVVEWDSEESFPASDPPGWAGSAGATREAPPAGPQAAWTVEHGGDAAEPPDRDGGDR